MKKGGSKVSIPNDLVSYLMGVISIVLAFFQPGAGIVFGIIGIMKAKVDKTDLSKRGKKLSMIGLILSIILLVIALAVTYYSVGVAKTAASPFEIY